MSMDITEKLRKRELRIAYGSDLIMAEALDEIERLRIERDQAIARAVSAEADADRLAKELGRWENNSNYPPDSSALEAHNKLKAERGT